MTFATPIPSDPDQNIREVRHSLKCLHGELRDLGLTPVEAVAAAMESIFDDLKAKTGRPSEQPVAPPSSEAQQKRNSPKTGRPSEQPVAPLSACDISDLKLFAETEGLNDNIFSLVYQEFLVPEARSGLGQYLTPLPVAEMIAQVIGSLAPPSASAMDPFCGSGILLNRLGASRDDISLTGVDINGTVCSMAVSLARLAARNIDLRVMDSFVGWAENSLPEVDVVVTNPPFGQTTTSVLQNSYLEVLPPCLRKMKRVPAELLGLEVSVDALRSGGYLAAVLPQSVLTNSSWSDYRRHVFSKIEPFGVVSLPEETFAPFRGVAKSCVLFGRKTNRHTWKSDTEGARVKYYRSLSVGYDETGRASKTESDMAEAAECMMGAGSETNTIEICEQGEVRIRPSMSVSKDSCVKLKDLAVVFCGRTPPRGEYVDGGPFLLKVGNLRGSFVSWSDRERQHITEEMFRRHPHLHLQPGDICLTAAAHRPRYIAKKVDLIYELPPKGAMPSAEVMVIRLNKESPMQPEELLFYLRSASGYLQLQDLVRGSTAHLYPSDVRETLIPTGKSDELSDAIRQFREAAQLHCQAESAEKAALTSAAKYFPR